MSGITAVGMMVHDTNDRKGQKCCTFRDKMNMIWISCEVLVQLTPKEKVSWLRQKSRQNPRGNLKSQGSTVLSQRSRHPGVQSRRNRKPHNHISSFNPWSKKPLLLLMFGNLRKVFPSWESGHRREGSKPLRSSSRKCRRIADWPSWWFPTSLQVIPVYFPASCKSAQACRFWKSPMVWR